MYLYFHAQLLDVDAWTPIRETWGRCHGSSWPACAARVTSDMTAALLESYNPFERLGLIVSINFAASPLHDGPGLELRTAIGQAAELFDVAAETAVQDPESTGKRRG